MPVVGEHVELIGHDLARTLVQIPLVALGAHDVLAVGAGVAGRRHTIFSTTGVQVNTSTEFQGKSD